MAQAFETIEVERRDRHGKLMTNSRGEMLTKTITRPKHISQLSEDLQQCIESVSFTETGMAVPKFHSKMAANQELRKFLNLGQTANENNDVRRLSDAELVAQLAQQAKELGIEIRLSYRLSGDRASTNQSEHNDNTDPALDMPVTPLAAGSPVAGQTPASDPNSLPAQSKSLTPCVFRYIGESPTGFGFVT